MVDQICKAYKTSTSWSIMPAFISEPKAKGRRSIRISVEEWNRYVAVNLSGAFYCSKYVIPLMRQTELWRHRQYLLPGRQDRRSHQWNPLCRIKGRPHRFDQGVGQGNGTCIISVSTVSPPEGFQPLETSMSQRSFTEGSSNRFPWAGWELSRKWPKASSFSYRMHPVTSQEPPLISTGAGSWIDLRREESQWKKVIDLCAFGLFLSLILFHPGLMLAAEKDYPNRPIEIIVGFAPGGATDLASRAVASTINEYLGQPAVVVNKARRRGHHCR